MAVAFGLFVASVFFPWVSESGGSSLAVYPGLGASIKYWSWQCETRVYQGFEPQQIHVLRFQEFWWGLGRPLAFSHGFFVIFVFQMITVVVASLSLVKDSVKGFRLPLYSAFSASSFALALGLYQVFLMEDAGGLVGQSVSLSVGYALALDAFFLWLALTMMYIARPRHKAEHS